MPPTKLLEQAIICNHLHKHCRSHIEDRVRNSIIDIHMKAMRLFDHADTDEAADDAVIIIQRCRECLTVLAETE